MIDSTLLLIVYCLLVVGASLLGGFLPMLVHLTHRRMQFAVSLVAGFMLGIALLHMLPHALASGQSPYALLRWLLLGLLTMFFIERFFCFHHHDVPEARAIEAAAHGEDVSAAAAESKLTCEHAHAHAHSHHDHSAHRLTWSGAALGLTLHSIIGGVALAAAVASDPGDAHAATLPGLGVFLVILLHKPFDSMSLITLMSVGGWTGGARHLINGLFALCTALGVLLFYVGFGWLAGEASGVVAGALAFSAGTFLCISLSDLLPELQFHQHDRGKLSAALLAGLALAWGIHLVEGSTHAHDHAGHSDHASHDNAIPAMPTMPTKPADIDSQAPSHTDHTDHTGHDH